MSDIFAIDYAFMENTNASKWRQAMTNFKATNTSNGQQSCMLNLETMFYQSSIACLNLLELGLFFSAINATLSFLLF